MVQEGLCLLCGHPHVPHFPAQPHVTTSAACQSQFQWHANLWQRQSMSMMSGMALPACYQRIRHSYVCALQLCTVALLTQQIMTVPCTSLQDHYCALCTSKVWACVTGITVLSTIEWACLMS